MKTGFAGLNNRLFSDILQVRAVENKALLQRTERINDE
jgi:hypothetical protein